MQLTEPSIVGSYAGCSSYYSCRVGRLVMINDNRWRYGTRSFADKPRHLYRQMVINHEVGHALGFDHRSCGGLGQRAPVMQQQSKGLAGCVANAWPVSSERRSLAQRLGVAIGPTPPGLDVGDRIGPITMGATRGAVFGRLGQPSSKVRRGDSYVYAFALEPIAVELTNRRVTAVSTRSGRFRTSRGLGVGSTRSDLRQSFTSHELLRDGLHPQGG